MSEEAPPNEADYCDECNSHQVFEVMSRWTKYSDEAAQATRWTVLRCPLCSSPRLYVQSSELSGYMFGDEFIETSEWLPRHVLFPSMPQLSSHAPRKVRDDFDEAQRCMSVNANTAASMMLRRALEQICLEHGVDDSVSFGLAFRSV